MPVYDDRLSGRTTKQMQEAPAGAVFVWCNGSTAYPRALAKRLGRDDLQVMPRAWLTHRSVYGMRPGTLVIDHAAELHWQTLRLVIERGLLAESPHGKAARDPNRSITGLAGRGRAP